MRLCPIDVLDKLTKEVIVPSESSWQKT
jgi:hypothetical protein